MPILFKTLFSCPNHSLWLLQYSSCQKPSKQNNCSLHKQQICAGWASLMLAFSWFFSLCALQSTGMAASVQSDKTSCVQALGTCGLADTRSNLTCVCAHALEMVMRPQSEWSEALLRGWGDCPLCDPGSMLLMPVWTAPHSRKHSAGVWPSVAGQAHQPGQLLYTSHTPVMPRSSTIPPAIHPQLEWEVMACKIWFHNLVKQTKTELHK